VFSGYDTSHPGHFRSIEIWQADRPYYFTLREMSRPTWARYGEIEYLVRKGEAVIKAGTT